MTIVKKKIWPKFFEAIASGKKTCELRLNDVPLNEGDTLVLEEWDPTTKQYTGRSLEKLVTYVSRFKLDELVWSEEEIRKTGLQVISFH